MFIQTQSQSPKSKCYKNFREHVRTGLLGFTTSKYGYSDLIDLLRLQEINKYGNQVRSGPSRFETRKLRGVRPGIICLDFKKQVLPKASANRFRLVLDQAIGILNK